MSSIKDYFTFITAAASEMNNKMPWTKDGKVKRKTKRNKNKRRMIKNSRRKNNRRKK